MLETCVFIWHLVMGFATSSLSARPWSQAASMCVHPRTFPYFPSVGEGKHQHMSWRCTVLPQEEKHLSSMTLQLPAPYGQVSDGKAGGMESMGRKGETGDPIFSVLSIQSISQFTNSCMSSLPNLAALWKIKGLLDQHIINPALKL